MARVFKRKDRLSAMSEINITSLLDLVFCLLIIFMITTPLLEQTLPVKLPAEAADAGLSPNPKTKYQAVSINEKGEMFYGTEPVTGEQMLARLQQLAAQPDPPVIDVREPATLAVQNQDDLLFIIHKSGLTKVSLDTQVR